MIKSAMACAAYLMLTPVPDVHVEVMVQPQSLVDWACPSDYNCGAVFFVYEGDKPTVWIVDPDNFPLLVHEMCHVIQWSRGQPFHDEIAEQRCLSAQAQVQQDEGVCRNGDSYAGAGRIRADRP